MTEAHESSHRRKDDHLRLAAEQHSGEPGHNDFDDIEFLHHALGGIDVRNVSTDVELAGRSWPVPLYVNGMTGGTPRTGEVNRTLAIAARETGLPIAAGSVGIALNDPAARAGFRVIREENPDGFVMANLGADRGPDDARRAVELLEADALQVHLNAVQETVMPEGRRAFSSWAHNIEAMLTAVDVPVIVKEVGFGLSRRTLEQLRDLGVRFADVGGTGGTDFVRIENARRSAGDYGFLAGWGQSAACCLLDAPAEPPALLASGGVRTPLDVVRALALGARAAGVAGAFLRVALDGGTDALVAEIRRWSTQLRELMALLGASRPGELIHSDVLVRGRVREYCELRGIDAAAFARRSTHDFRPRTTGDTRDG
jgi:isopentenyl-diphosphate delta-isomerase